MMTLDDLIAKGYFPKELPPPFTSESLARYVTNIGVPSLPTATKKLTLPTVHYLSRSGVYRRVLQIPNPANFISLCSMIANNWTVIDTHLNKSTFSVSRPVADPLNLRALRTKVDGQNLDNARARNRASSLFILRTDIARYYASIYTHSIPWALDGKAYSKTHRRGGLGNDLDQIVRDAQDQQTLGIPIGPDTSLVIAEVIGCAIDSKLQAEGLSGIRYMDDFELAFDNRSEAEKALSKIEEVLAHFELAINPLKTAIFELPIGFGSQWAVEIRSYDMALGFISAADLIRYFSIEPRSKTVPDENDNCC